MRKKQRRLSDEFYTETSKCGTAEEMAQAIENHLAVYGSVCDCNCRFHRALEFGDGDSKIDVNVKKPLSQTLEELCPGVGARNRPSWATMNSASTMELSRIEPKMTQEEEDEQ